MNSDRYTQLPFKVPLTHPELLEGLEMWLRLGLISDSKVREFCQQNLICKRPEVLSTAASPSTDPLEEARETRPTRPPQTRKRKQAPALTSSQQQGSDWLTQLLQSFMAELSVLWLLLLGVFMVVVSSGVLAATQWQYFTPTGQYGLLLAYTLVFAAVAYGLNRRPKLQLTARMLQVTTLLIIPVNFWMMDQLNLFRSGVGWLVGMIAAFSLTAIMVGLLHLNREVHSPLWTRISRINSIGLSWLHWGWGHPNWPWFATYGGMLATCIALVYEDYRQGNQSSNAPETSENSAPSLWLQPSRIAVIGGLLLLLFRAMAVAQIPLPQMSVAIALGGALLCWLGRRSAPGLEFWFGGGLLLLGRWASLSSAFPGQALIISGLAIAIFSERLHRRSQIVDLVCVFGIGLQALWPLRRVIPEIAQQQVVTTAIQWAPSDVGMPTALWGVGLFPYCLFTLWLGSKLRQRRSGALTRVAEGLALALGLSLTALSCWNPLTRSLNLVLSALTLSVIVSRRPNAHSALLYLTQITGLAALFTTLNLMVPDLSLTLWAGFLLVAMVCEWSISSWLGSSRWQSSAWSLGLVLSAISYVLWASQAEPWRTLWLITPLMLTLMGMRSSWRRPRLAAGLSLFALVVAQFLIFPWTASRLVGLGLSTVLTVLNTRILRHSIAGGFTVGFGLTFLYASFWEVRQGQVSFGLFLNCLAATALLLWLLHRQVGRHEWGRWYVKGLNAWAWMLNSLNLLVVSFVLGLVYLGWATLGGSGLTPQHLIVAMGMASTAIAYHSWRHPTEFSRFQVAWGIELLTASVLQLRDGAVGELAIANLTLGILSLGIGTLWARRANRNYHASKHWIPLFYGGLGWLLGHYRFTAVTGIYTLVASLIVVGISRRRQNFKALSFLAMAGFSWGAYELLIYQLLQMVGGRPADGWLMFALLATVIAGCEYFFAPWLAQLVNLSVREFQIIAHLHWMGASGLALVALLGGLSPTGAEIWIGVVSGLAIYALIQGRRREDWIYAGIFDVLSALGYGLYLTVPIPFLQEWGSIFACLLALGFYRLPWSDWGWSQRPWRQAAISLPVIATVATATAIQIPSLLIAGAFYAWLALQEQRPRISYLSLLLGDWAIWRVLGLYQLQGGFAIACLIGGSFLYIAQVDPVFQPTSARNQRHALRTLATGLICLSALVESDAQLLWGFAAAGVFLALILSGLVLRVRAFAYIGTLFFGLKVVRQLWLFVADHSFLLWAIGIVVGLVFIWVAATFEARRSQMTALLSYWVDELQSWA